MSIAQVSPLFESVPPRAYGGTERVVSWLTEELVRQGHEVTLFASGDSVTAAELVPACGKALWQDPTCLENLAHHVRQLELVYARASDFDVIHFHTDFVHFPLVRRHSTPAVTTLHGALNATDHVPLFEEYDDVPLVSISDSQRRGAPRGNYRATVYHGMPLELQRFDATGGDYLAFLGRVSPQKGLDRAIAIAILTQRKLKIAARIYSEERSYYEQVIAPLIREAGDLVEFVGEVSGDVKDEFLRRARTLVFPIDWQEPFGLVMIEALAAGTPVVAFRNGSVPEVIDDGTTGYIVDSVEEAAAAVGRIEQLDRRVCRDTFERRFGVEQMANGYIEVYQDLLERRSGPRLISFVSERPRALTQ